MMELVNNDSRLLLVATSHKNTMSISNTLVKRHNERGTPHKIKRNAKKRTV